jgi:hypothetical protein
LLNIRSAIASPFLILKLKIAAEQITMLKSSLCMPKEIIETRKYILSIDAENNYMEFSIKEGITFDVADAIEVKDSVTCKFPDTKFYVLAEGVEFFTITKAAREHCATKEHLDNTICIAFYTRNISLLLLGEIFNKINKPAVTTKFFNNRNVAAEWLKAQMRTAREYV